MGAVVGKRSSLTSAATCSLADGRRLGYAVYGAPEGRPLLFFHGTPGSRMMAGFAAAAAHRCGIRLVAPERPGYGLSDPQPGRVLLDWPEDVRQLTDSLGLQRFALVGVSGGGPYAAACAWRLPERVTALGLVSSLAPREELDQPLPWSRRLLALILRHPRLTTPFLAVLAKAVRRQPEQLLHVLLPLAPREDRLLLARPDIRHLQLDGLVQACRQGAQATAQDLAIFTQPWGFSLSAIRVPTYLWHGGRDQVVPVTMGRCLAARISGCRARFLNDAGHLWIFEGYEEVLQTLAEAWPVGIS